MMAARMLRGIAAVGLSLALAALVSGCALESAPMPPSLHIPKPVRNLAATRAGDAVTLQWTMPKRTTDKAALKGKVKAEICRLPKAAAGVKNSDKNPASEIPCEATGSVMLPPGVQAKYVDPLPSALEQGAPRLLTYAVRLYGPYRRTAGYSNSATVVAGAAPPAVGNVKAQVRPDGIVLRWATKSPEPGMEMQMVRTLLLPKAAAKAHPQKSDLMQGAGPVERQVLAVSLTKKDAGQALDRNATLDHTYTYSLQRMVKLKVDGTSAELAGAASPVVTVIAKDVFPPSVPQGLVAVTDAEARSIDLSWEPSPEQDTAGYIVYRRTDDGAWQRISPLSGLEKGLVTAPAWNDVTAQPGTEYEYAVAAVDRDGNQSARSASAKEELPQQQ